MKKFGLFSVLFIAAVCVASITSCDNSPKQEVATTQQKAPLELKIAFVEVDSLMSQYEFCKEYALILEKKSRNVQSTLQQKQQKLQQDATAMQQKYQSNGFSSQEELQRAQAGLQKQSNDLDALQQRLGGELQEEAATYNKALHDSLEHFLARYNKDKKYTLILSKSGDNILYADKGIDITNEIIAGLNKAYKKGATAKATTAEKEEKKK